MFIGHFAVGFAAKRAAPKASLGTTFMAAQTLDLLWPVFLLTGTEHVRIDPGNTVLTPLDFYDYPVSHSLAGTTVWALLFAGIHFAVRRDGRTALVLAGCVMSHWILDVISHRPDMPVGFTGNTRLGLGLWNHPALSVLVELAMFCGGLWIYLRMTTAARRTGRWALASLVVFLLAIFTGNLWGPPPPDVMALAIAGNAQWLIILWGYWIDRNRVAAVPGPAPAAG